MFCSECGKQVEDSAKFCGECGTVQTTAGLETSTTASNRIQSCPSCNIKGWEHGKQCGSCGYVEGEEVTTRNKLQASVTSPSSGKSSRIGVFLLWAIIIAAALFALKHFQKQTETAQSNQVVSRDKVGDTGISESPNIANGLIEVVLERKDVSNVGDFCDLYFELRNKTNLNFTALGIEFISRDAAGNIVEKKALRERVAPSSSAITSSSTNNCSSITSIEITGVADHSNIDGEFIRDKSKVTSIPIKSATKVAGISIKSSAGALDDGTQANTGHEIVNQLSYCAAIAVGQSIWNRQNGNEDVASTLEKGAFAYAKTAVEFGVTDGLSEADVVSLNKTNSNNVTEEMKGRSFFDGGLLNEKNNKCLNMVKNNPTLLSIWQRYFDR